MAELTRFIPEDGAGDVAGTNIPFTVDGKRYEVERPTVVHLAMIEDAIAEAAYVEAEAMADRAKTDREKKRAQGAMEHVNRTILEEHAHKVGGRLWVDTLTSPNNLAVHILWACLVPRSEDPRIAAVRLPLDKVEKLIQRAEVSGGLTRAMDGLLNFFITAVADLKGLATGPILEKMEAARAEIRAQAESLTRGIPS